MALCGTFKVLGADSIDRCLYDGAGHITCGMVVRWTLTLTPFELLVNSSLLTKLTQLPLYVIGHTALWLRTYWLQFVRSPLHPIIFLSSFWFWRILKYILIVRYRLIDRSSLESSPSKRAFTLSQSNNIQYKVLPLLQRMHIITSRYRYCLNETIGD